MKNKGAPVLSAALAAGVFLAAGELAFSQEPELQTHLLEVPEDVWCILEHNGQWIIGGEFSLLNGERRSSLARVDRYGNPVAAWAPDIKGGNVYAMAADPEGQSLYIGGSFTQVCGQARARLAKLNLSDGTLDSTFIANADGAVYALLLTGDGLYVGGGFSSINSVARLNLARLNANNGAPDGGFMCAADFGVFDIALDGTNLFVAGTFTTLGGKARGRLAKVSPSGSVFDSFTNSANANVFSLAVDGTNLYVGGEFTQCNGLSMRYLAKMSTSGQLDLGFSDKNPDGYVYSVCVYGGALYIGGEFDTVQGQERFNIARLDKTTGLLDASFAANVSTYMRPWREGYVKTIMVSGSYLVVGGNFCKANDYFAPSVVKLDLNTGTADTSFRTRPCSPSLGWCIARQPDGKIVVGGKFNIADGRLRYNLARFDAAGALDPDWGPEVSGTVEALAADETGIYVGGNVAFSIGWENRYYLAKLTLNTGGVIAAFNPNPDNVIKAIAVSGTNLYAGGNFENIGGSPADFAVKLNPNTGMAHPSFTNSPDGPVDAMLVADNSLYMGGSFKHVAGQTSRNLARVDLGTGLPVPGFLCMPSNTVSALVHDGVNLYFGGTFTNVYTNLAFAPSCQRPSIAKVRTSDSLLDPAFTNGTGRGGVLALALSGPNLYVGGIFTSACGQARSRLARFNAANGALDTSFTNQADRRVRGLLADGHRLYAAGEFDEFSGSFSPGFAVLYFPPAAPVALPATNIGVSSFNANWGAAAGATNYLLDVSTSSGFATFVDGYRNRSVGDALTCAVTGLMASATHYYRVRAQHDGGISSNSATVSATTLTPATVPDAPGNVQATDGTYTNRVRVSWNVPAGAYGFTVWRNTSDSSGSASQIGSSAASPYDDYTAAAGVLYYYWVRATNHLGSSAFSGSDYGYRATAAGEPVIPKEVNASDGAYIDRVQVTWTAGFGATGYEVYRGRVGDSVAPALVGTTASTGYSDTTARHRVRYAYWVRAFNAAGQTSPFSVPDIGWRRGLPAGYSNAARSDFAVFDQNTGCWYIMSADGTLVAWAFAWGWPGAWPVPGDYDGDGLNDLAVFDQNTGWWFVMTLDGRLLAWAYAWGWPGAWPVPGDYDGDGRSDCAVFDQNTGWWFVISLNSTTPIAWAFAWGWPGAWPVSGDYDGDGVSDCAVFDQNTGWWFVISLNGTAPLAWAYAWGWPGAWPVPGDYDGDGRSDCAVFDQNTGWWFVIPLNSATPLAWAFAWGWPGAWPVPGDYDGDGRSDCAVFDQNTGWWFVISLNGTAPIAWAFPWGWPGAWPVGWR